MTRALIEALLALQNQDGEAESPVRSQDLRESSDIQMPAGVRKPTLKIIAVGGAGLNILSRIPMTELEGAEVLATDTDAVHLMLSGVPRRISMVASPGMLSGSDSGPANGRNAALEAKEELGEALHGARYVIVLCGLGGGTGTGAAPVIARIARDAGSMTAAVCVWPFAGEGRVMEMNAEQGVRRLMKAADVVVLVPNDMIMRAKSETPMNNALVALDALIIRAVRDVSDFFISLDARS